MQGIKNFYAVLANVLFTSNTVLATVGLKSPIAAGQRQKFRAWIPVTVGGTGGLQLQVVIPAAATLITTSILLVNTVAPSVTSAIQTSSTPFTNALANAGSHWLEVEGEVTNGANAGSIDIQLAQNSSNATALTVLAGGSMDITIY